MHLLIIGDGRMGRAIEALATERGHGVLGVLGRDDNRDAAGISRKFGRTADVALEFTRPDAARANLLACVHAGLPVVTGTTGWYDALPEIEDEVRRAERGAIFWAPNFSVGVALAGQLARSAGKLFAAHPQFDARLIETHHKAKVDAPSGTATAWSQATTEHLRRDVPITSVRLGHVPGIHSLIFDGPFEQITITHEARDRRVFADGALRAAEWLVGRRGVFTMQDLLDVREDL